MLSKNIVHFSLPTQEYVEKTPAIEEVNQEYLDHIGVSIGDKEYEYNNIIKTSLAMENDAVCEDPLLNVQSVKMVPMGKEYFAWLKENSLTNTPDNAVKYSLALDDATITKLFKSKKYDTNYLLYYIPLCLISNRVRKYNTKIKEITKERIIEYLSHFAKPSDIAVFDSFLDYEIIDTYAACLLQSGKEYFKTKDESHLKLNFVPDTQNIPKDQMIVELIPVVIRVKNVSPIVNLEELRDCEKILTNLSNYIINIESTCFTDDELEEFFKASIEKYNEMREIVRKKVKKNFDSRISALSKCPYLPYLISSFDVPTSYFCYIFEKEVDEKTAYNKIHLRTIYNADVAKYAIEDDIYEILDILQGLDDDDDEDY